MIAASGPIDLQAQAGPAQVAAKGQLQLKTANGVATLAAAKKLVLAVSGGASIVVEGGQISVQCPGTLTIKAGKKSMVGPGTLSWTMPSLPKSALPVQDMDFDLMLTDVPGAGGHPLAHTAWKIARSSQPPEGMAWVTPAQLVTSGESDQAGRVVLDDAQKKTVAEAYNRHPNQLWLVYPGQAVQIDMVQEQASWSLDEMLMHALSAADFSADVHAHRHQDGATDELQQARQGSQSRSDQDLARKLKGS